MSKRLVVLNKYFLLIYYIFLVVLYLLTRDPKIKFDETSAFFSVVIFVIFGALLLVKVSPVRLFGLSADKLTGKLFLSILPMFLFTNLYLIFLDKILGQKGVGAKSLTVVALLKTLFPSGQIAKFGEELVFRGFLLAKTVSSNNNLWWAANVSQALVFAAIHALTIRIPLGTKIHFVVFVIALSLVYGLLNRKFQSLLPSAILHSTNGLVGSLLGFIS